MKRVIEFVKRETVLVAAWALALLSMLAVPPDSAYAEYIDWRSLGILWGLMVIMQGLSMNGLFVQVGAWLLGRTRGLRQLLAVLVFLCFFSSMLITNDVALITFVPFAILILRQCGQEALLLPTVILQTVAANLGSMLTPVGNPQNLYLYGLSGMSIGAFLLRMLPYTALSGLLLGAALLLIRGVSAGSLGNVALEQREQGNRTRILAFLALFALALLVVVRLVPYGVLVAAVLLTACLLERTAVRRADYALLLTFIGFFVFTGNIARVPAIQGALEAVVGGHEVAVGVLASQCISNVPAALLLSGFTARYDALLIGVNLGGLGTLIASMASLISYKLFAHDYDGQKGRYLLWFSAVNVVFLALLLAAYAVLG